ncbi:SOS response-associated peptidase [Rhodocyclaceae bacterium SMB388]
MCGRYALYGPVSRLRETFDAEVEGFDFAPRYNAAPMQWLPVIRQRPGGERVVQALRWGLIPAWAKDEAIATRLINARGETVADKPSFRSAFRRRRCIVPMNGFYEWRAVPGGKQPHYIHAAHDALLGVAGLWERWTRPGDGESLDTFTVITTDANDALRPLHDRMPVILPPEAYGTWLDAGVPAQDVASLIRPAADRLLQYHAVSTAVGNVRHESPDLIVPAKSGSGGT